MTTVSPSRRNLLLGAAAGGAAVLSAPAQARTAQETAARLETGRYRVVTSLDVALPYLGVLKPRSTDEIAGSNWLIGCETLDRDFADYEQYKAYIAPLGIKRLRMQAGWAKTETVRGRYDFAWLDRIIDDAVGRRLMPWLQTSYGNTLYPGGGGANLGAGLPTSPEALAAYDRWVEAMVTRYRTKVFDWEVWNEPNFGDNTINTPEHTADFNVQTANIIKRLQPSARISGLALGHYNKEFVDRFFDRVQHHKAFDLFDNITYHDYVYNPDSNVGVVEAIRASLDRYAPGVKLRQGENGAPSAGGPGRGALWDYPWSELTQAKWNTRRMLGNLGIDVECSVFGLVEMAYTHGPINRLNFKGLLKSDESKRVIRPKIAYYAVQNVAAVFDDRLERIKGLTRTMNLAAVPPGADAYTHSTDRHLAVFGYRSKATGKPVYTLWRQDDIPVDANDLSLQTFSVTNAAFDNPVWIDVVTGAVHRIPEAQWRRKGDATVFDGIPVYDSPILLADQSLISL